MEAARQDAQFRFRAEMQKQSEGGPNVEIPTAKMFGALLQGGPHIQSLINEAAVQGLVTRRVSVGASLSHFRTTVIHYFDSVSKEAAKNPSELFHDAYRTSIEAWRKPIEHLEEDLSTEGSIAVDNILYSDFFLGASTPVISREGGPELITQLARDRFPRGGIRRLDFGSSVGAGALWAAYKDEFPMQFEKVLIEPAREGPVPLIDVTVNANRIQARPSLYSKIVCLDRLTFYRPDLLRWDEGMSSFAISGLRPSERFSDRADTFDGKRPNGAGVVRALMEKKRKGSESYDPDSPVVFKQGDLLQDEDLANFKDEFVEPFDIITVNYVTQELPPEDQLRLHRILVNLLSENGILMYVHQAEIVPAKVGEPTDIGNVRHLQSYAVKSWLSNLHFQDNLHPTRGLQQGINFYDNRNRQARLSTAGRLMVNGALEPISDLVRYAR